MYATTMKMRKGEWRPEPMLSLGGVYAPSTNNKQSKLPIALENMTQNQTQINTFALHLDNDFAGRNATKSITEQLRDRFIIRDEPPLYGKDCNDYLLLRRYCNAETVDLRRLCSSDRIAQRKARHGSNRAILEDVF